jgi:archaellum component FlaC
MAREIEILDGIVKRKYTEVWKQSSIINYDNLPRMVSAVVDQKNAMIEYIEALHDKIDEMIGKTNWCDICKDVGCTSDHK